MSQANYQQHPNFKTAQRNEKLFQALLTGAKKYQHREWMLTVLFYASLHYLKSYLSIVHQLPSSKIDSHKGILMELNRLKKSAIFPKKILQKYEQFKNDSQLARYHYLENFPEWNDHKFVDLVQNKCVQRLDLIRDFTLQELEKL